MSTSNTDAPSGLPAREKRYSWFRILTVVVPFLLFLVLVAWLLVPQQWWTPWQTPLGKDHVQALNPSPAVARDRKAELEHRIQQIDEQIPALLGEMQWLAARLKRQEAQNPSTPDARDTTTFIGRETTYIQQRIENLQADRAFYAKELREQ